MAITCSWVFFYYTTSESKLPTSFHFLPCFLPFFPSFLARVRVRCFLFFVFTSSPGVYISLSLSEIGVKTFVFYPSPFHATCLVPADCPFSPVSCWHDGPIGQVGADTPEGEGFWTKSSPISCWITTKCAGWVKAWRQKTKSAWRAHAREQALDGRKMGAARKRKTGAPEKGSARRKDREKNNEERYALSFSKISPSPDFLTRMGCVLSTLPLKMAFERSLSKKFCKARFTGRAP